MDAYQQYIHKSRYARYLPEEQRRESWGETVNRYLDFWVGQDKLTSKEAEDIFTKIHGMEVMPSMRALMTAGEALSRDNVAGFNCAYLPIDHPKAFDEMMYVLMCGTGVGFSVERQYIQKLPEVAEELHDTDTVIHVADSKIGWAKAYRELISMLFAGQVAKWDVSGVRASGEPLKTFGGRASGPEPLIDLFQFTVEVFRGSIGRKLSSIECHDLCCKIAQVVVVGGVRRSALISLSNLTDDRIRRCKSGQWWVDNPQRGLSNNSACYTEKPDFEAFLNEWKSLYESRSGERGVFSRVASQRQAAKNGRRDATVDFGTNPCSEIILRPYQFCNLSEVVVRPEDTLNTLKEKVKTAAILGTLQATLTNFRYLRKIWQDNTEEEALLGVSLTGIMDHPIMSGRKKQAELKQWLTELKEEAIKTNKEWAERLGINVSTAITAVKPSGTVSQLVDSASGIHPRYSEQYVRRVRADARDPLCGVLEAAGVPVEDDVMSATTKVFSFPVKSPKDAIVATDMGAMEQLKLWEIYQDYWCEHKPSMTCYYRDDEFLEVGQWLYNKFDKVSGISFLPYAEHSYQQAPYEPVDKATYSNLVADFPKSIEWNVSEASDMTEGSQQLACTGNSCEI
jgi:ribonucleoside-triphosphate reductase|tara:strand:- start:5233 stop:7104 length:1872 start_codon:yes stop_codon:yes gene_type:complete